MDILRKHFSWRTGSGLLRTWRSHKSECIP
jgi:hypothetical protein